jgi:hypothetical protein
MLAKYAELAKLLQECISECNDELQRTKNSIHDEIYRGQIQQVVLPELHQIIEYIKNNQLASKGNKYLLSFGYALKVWNWDMWKPMRLYLQLLAIHNILEKL